MNLKLPNLKLPSTCVALLALALPVFGQSSETNDQKIDWTIPLPCDPSYFATELSGQPAAGLVLFRFTCPNTPTKLISGVKQILIPVLYSPDTIKKHSDLSRVILNSTGGAWIANMREIPISSTQITGMRAKQDIEANTPLLLRYFEKRKLWVPMNSISVQINLGNVTTNFTAIATSQGQFGEPSSAKLESGKTVNGTASLCNDIPCLIIKP